MTEKFLRLPDGYGETKLMPVYDGFTGQERMSFQGFGVAAKPTHFTTHDLEAVDLAIEFLSDWAARMREQQG